MLAVITRRIPRTDFDVFPLNLGGNPFGWTADERATFEVLDSFVEAGGNFIDTADVYSAWAEGHAGGESEELIGRWLKERDAYDKVVVATKGGSLEPHNGLSHDAVLSAVDASRRRLGIDTIDLYYYHHDDEEASIVDQVATAQELVDSGRVRHLALSNHSPERAREFFEAAQGTAAMPVALQPQYSLLHRGDVENGYGALAEEFDAALLPYFSLASGMLTGKYRRRADMEGAAREDFLSAYDNDEAFAVVDVLVKIAEARDAQPATVALSWLLAKGVTAPIASVSRTEQLPALIAAPSLELTAAEVVELDAVSEPFKG